MGIAAALSLTLSIAGCSRIGMPFNEAGDGIDPIQTGSLVSAKVNDRVDPRDWSTVRDTLGRIPARAQAGTAIDWWNDLTNSSGTVATLTVAAERDGGICRDFAATINDLRGIRRYQGRACRGNDGWDLSNVAPDSAATL